MAFEASALDVEGIEKTVLGRFSDSSLDFRICYSQSSIYCEEETLHFRVPLILPPHLPSGGSLDQWQAFLSCCSGKVARGQGLRVFPKLSGGGCGTSKPKSTKKTIKLVGATVYTDQGKSEEPLNTSEAIQPPTHPDLPSSYTKAKLLESINAGAIGHRQLIKTPYGLKPLMYTDYTASGRCLSFIEDYIRKEVMPTYSNTHTSANLVAKQTTFLRQEARKIIHRSVNGSEDDVVIFCGSGSTAAINKMVQILQRSRWGTDYLCIPKNQSGSYECALCTMSFSSHGNYFHHLNSQVHREKLAPETERVKSSMETPVVFVSCYEHHSNLLPWREAGATVEAIPEDANGLLDIGRLEELLIHYSEYRYKFGSFSACSNVSGIMTNTFALAEVLHAHNAFAFFDFASAAPYVPINMNLTNHSWIDAIFISTHKFPGGPNTPGVLVAKKFLLGNKVPTMPGGGTVFFVTSKDHTYILDNEEREEGGTPDIIGAIRAGLVFQLKEAVSTETIAVLEQAAQKKILARLQSNQNIIILGNLAVPRIAIMSFLVRCANRFLHDHFVSALLNDLFGIETRAGCACAGPYSQEVLGISYPMAKAYEDILCLGFKLFRPGFTRANLPYFASEEEVEYILSAIEFVANHGYWFLPQYKFDMVTGEFEHLSFEMKEGGHNPQISLGEISYATGQMSYPEHQQKPAESLAKYQTKAFAQLEKIKEEAYAHYSLDDQANTFPANLENMRWFVLPSEVLAHIQRRTEEPMVSEVSPFYPPTHGPLPQFYPGHMPERG